MFDITKVNSGASHFDITTCIYINQYWKHLEEMAAKQDYEIKKLNERDCEPFRWCFCNSGLSSQGLSTHGRLLSLADTLQSKG
ncbi:hypothetical protein QYF36_013018 [Acer negundo]|nr:hypothetical protein QYF36_013018 [Acer negundo]